MKLVTSSMIREIDAYAAEYLNISVEELMKRSGHAVAEAVRSMTQPGAEVIILAGKGNNGGDGYAAAMDLMQDYRVTVYDVLHAGQKSDAGKEYLRRYTEAGGALYPLEMNEKHFSRIRNCGCIVDAIFGTGFSGVVPDELRPLAKTIRETVGAHKIAVDVPLGIDADTGEASDFAITVSATVELSFIKTGIVSYPARSYVGKIIYSDLGLPYKEIAEHFDLKNIYVDSTYCSRRLPKREENSSKGNFGKLLVITGSEVYRGAADLSVSAALRGGCGYVTYLGCESLCRSLSQKYPEVIYHPVKNPELWSEDDLNNILAFSQKFSAVLIGSGSGNTKEIEELVCKFLATEGCPVLLDADAVNSISEHRDHAVAILKDSKRQVVLTPHPLEFSRLSGIPVSEVQLHRIRVAKEFAAKTSSVLVLKGAATVITDGDRVLINSAGSSALAKAGSGDVLAGMLASLLASGTDPLLASALGCFIHARAGDVLAEKYSSYGVTPSDLPLAMAEEFAKLQKAE